MSTTKQIGLGTILDMDPANGTTWSAVSLISVLTPPGRTRAEVEAGTLGDTFHAPAQGREESSEFTFTQYWHPNDTDHERIDDAFDGTQSGNSGDVGDVAAWRITYPHGGTASGSTAPIDTFSGWVKTIGPEQVEPNGLFSRQVTIQRTTAITRSTRVLS